MERQQLLLLFFKPYLLKSVLAALKLACKEEKALAVAASKLFAYSTVVICARV